MEKYKIDFMNGCAIKQELLLNGKIKTRRFAIYTDTMGLKILTRNGIVFLTELNSEVI